MTTKPTLILALALAGALHAADYPQWGSGNTRNMVSDEKGLPIAGLAEAAELPGKIFHAGTSLHDGEVVTNGGRVLCAVGLGDDVSTAQRAAYALVDRLCFKDIRYRRDIGHRAIARERG